MLFRSLRIIWSREFDVILFYSVLFQSFYSLYFKRILRNAGVKPVLDFPTVGENLAGQFSFTFISIISTIYFACADHVHSWANAFTNASQVTLCSFFHGPFTNTLNCRVTRDLLLLNGSFQTEQRNLWFHNRTGQASSIFILFNILKTLFKACSHMYHDLLV